MTFPQASIELLKANGVLDVDYILQHVPGYPTPAGVRGNDNSSISKAIGAKDEGCSNCGKTSNGTKASLGIKGVLNALGDNYLWEKGSTIVYCTLINGWPDKARRDLVATWNQLDLGITVIHDKDRSDGITHPIQSGGGEG